MSVASSTFMVKMENCLWYVCIPYAIFSHCTLVHEVPLAGETRLAGQKGWTVGINATATWQQWSKCKLLGFGLLVTHIQNMQMPKASRQGFGNIQNIKTNELAFEMSSLNLEAKNAISCSYCCLVEYRLFVTAFSGMRMQKLLQCTFSQPCLVLQGF